VAEVESGVSTTRAASCRGGLVLASERTPGEQPWPHPAGRTAVFGDRVRLTFAERQARGRLWRREGIENA
jgi:hypothetical protein